MNIKRFVLISALCFISIAMPLSVFAVEGSTGGIRDTGGTGIPGPGASGGSTGTYGSTLINPLGSGASIPGLVSAILALVVRIGAIVVVVMLVYVGFLFVAARGNESKITEAKKALLWTVIGALILLGSQAIAIGIQATVQSLSVGQ